MLRCREVTEVVAETKSLSWWQKPILWMHLGVCAACRLYAKQMQIIKDSAKQLNQNKTDLKAEENLINKIIDRIE